VKGPSPAWHLNPAEERVLKLLEHYTEFTDSSNVGQSDNAKHHVQLKWFLWAHMNGDFSYVPYNGGEKLFPDYVRYDNKDRAIIKQEMALATAAVLDGVDGESASRMLESVFKAADKYNVNPNAVFDMGHNFRNPLNIEPFLRGDDDELS
jgi:hypothetical protein